MSARLSEHLSADPRDSEQCVARGNTTREVETGWVGDSGGGGISDSHCLKAQWWEWKGFCSSSLVTMGTDSHLRSEMQMNWVGLEERRWWRRRRGGAGGEERGERVTTTSISQCGSSHILSQRHRVMSHYSDQQQTLVFSATTMTSTIRATVSVAELQRHQNCWIIFDVFIWRLSTRAVRTRCWPEWILAAVKLWDIFSVFRLNILSLQTWCLGGFGPWSPCLFL